MEIEVLENNNILVKKSGRYFLIEKYHIIGSCSECYAIYEDIYNNLENFLNSEEEDRYSFGSDYSTLEECLKALQICIL